MILRILIMLCIVFLNTLNSSFASEITAAFEQQVADNKGKVIYVDFWASWCGPCRQSFPWMNDMQHQYAEQGLMILSINVDAKKTLAEQFLQQTPAEFPILYDSKGELAKQFKLRGMPSSYLINRNGELVSAHVGFNDNKKQLYQREILELLEQPKTNENRD